MKVPQRPTAPSLRHPNLSVSRSRIRILPLLVGNCQKQGAPAGFRARVYLYGQVRDRFKSNVLVILVH